MSQADLGDVLDVSRQTVNSIETGRTARPCRWRSAWGDGAPYTWLAAFAGATYVGAVLTLARRA